MWAVLFVLTTIAGLGVLLWVLAWQAWQKRVAMRRWPTAPATVHGHRTRMSGRSPMIDVEVSYRHDGRDYRVWCVSPTGSGYGRGTVQAERQMAAIFPVRSVHPAYLNPARAGEAFLQLPEVHLLAILVGSGVILMGLVASFALQVTSGLDAELANLLFFALLGMVLSVLVIFLGVALIKTPLPRPRRRR